MQNKLFFSVIFLAFLLSGFGCFSKNDQITELPFETIPGEVFVRLLPGFERDDLQLVIDDFEVDDFDLSIKRKLGTGYIVNVPLDFEPLWITQFSSVPIVADAEYNRFGYEYSITVNDSLPYAIDDEITVIVNYSGCDGGHAFSLQRPGAFTPNMAIWLYKATPDEDCEMAVSEELTFSLTRFIQLATQVVIEDPFGNQGLLWPIPEEPEED